MSMETYPSTVRFGSGLAGKTGLRKNANVMKLAITPHTMMARPKTSAACARGSIAFAPSDAMKLKAMINDTKPFCQPLRADKPKTRAMSVMTTAADHQVTEAIVNSAAAMPVATTATKATRRPIPKTATTAPTPASPTNEPAGPNPSAERMSPGAITAKKIKKRILMMEWRTSSSDGAEAGILTGEIPS